MNDDPKLLIVVAYVVVAPLLGLVEPVGAVVLGNDPQHGFPVEGPANSAVLSRSKARPSHGLTPGVEVEH